MKTSPSRSMRSRASSLSPETNERGPRNFLLLVAYDGSPFCGFQRQQSQPSIQEELEKALSTILREEIRVHPSGRTDAGVHATGQVVHFICKENKLNIEERRLCHGLNALLPPEISVLRAAPVPFDFHARFSCLAREYDYLIWNHPRRRAHSAEHFLWVREELDCSFLQKQADGILGENDFRSLTRVLSESETPMRYIDLLRFDRIRDPIMESESIVRLRIRGNAFLHNMIRILVGTLLDIHAGKIELSLKEILEKKDRRRAGKTAPPTGLFFRRAYYLQSDLLPDWLPQLDGYPWMREGLDPRNVVATDHPVDTPVL